jgi:hypothetical protein
MRDRLRCLSASKTSMLLIVLSRPAASFFGDISLLAKESHSRGSTSYRRNGSLGVLATLSAQSGIDLVLWKRTLRCLCYTRAR